MALSARMLAVLQRVDAAREEFFVGLRERARQEAAETSKRKQLANAKKKPAMKKPPLRVTSTAATTDKPHKDRKEQKQKPKPRR